MCLKVGVDYSATKSLKRSEERKNLRCQHDGSNSQKVMNFSRADEALKKVVPSTRFKLAP